MHDTLYYGDRPMYQIWSANVKPEIRRYMAEILPIRRKTLSKQSINQSNPKMLWAGHKNMSKIL